MDEKFVPGVGFRPRYKILLQTGFAALNARFLVSSPLTAPGMSALIRI